MSFRYFDYFGRPARMTVDDKDIPELCEVWDPKQKKLVENGVAETDLFFCVNGTQIISEEEFEVLLKPIGYTGGWGHFHIPDSLFLDLRDYLRINGHSYADENRFGQGPNWRLRTTRTALKALGFNGEMLRHGIQREVFICQLANNALKLLHSGRGKPDLSSLLSADEVAHLAVERWMLPRSQRRPEFRAWKRENIAALLGDQPGKLLSKLSVTG